jgi:hypothetical protein
MATEQRLPRYSAVPTLKERGINVIAHSPYGLVGPKDLPPAIAQTIHEAFAGGQQRAVHPAVPRQVRSGAVAQESGRVPCVRREYYNGVKPLLIKAGLVKT